MLLGWHSWHTYVSLLWTENQTVFLWALIKMIDLWLRQHWSHWTVVQEVETLFFYCSVGTRWQEANSTISNDILISLFSSAVRQQRPIAHCFLSQCLNNNCLSFHSQFFINSLHETANSFMFVFLLQYCVPQFIWSLLVSWKRNLFSRNWICIYFIPR